MFSGSQSHRIGYILFAIALLGVGVWYILDAHNAQAAELSTPQQSLVLECSSCHSDAPQVTNRAAMLSEPCDACHDEAPAKDRVISPNDVGRELVQLESSFATFGRWDNPIQKHDTRYQIALDQLWQAKVLLGAADEPDELLDVQALITEAQNALAQLENEAKWGFWESFDSPELPTEAVASSVHSPVPVQGHTFWESLSYLKPLSDPGMSLELVGLLVLSLCVLLVALRRAPPDEHHNIFLNTNLPLRRRASGDGGSPFLFALFFTNSLNLGLQYITTQRTQGGRPSQIYSANVQDTLFSKKGIK